MMLGIRNEDQVRMYICEERMFTEDNGPNPQTNE